MTRRLSPVLAFLMVLAGAVPAWAQAVTPPGGEPTPGPGGAEVGPNWVLVTVIGFGVVVLGILIVGAVLLSRRRPAGEETVRPSPQEPPPPEEPTPERRSEPG